MRVAVFGSTGGTGREVVRQALAAGHDVTALARRPTELPPRPRLATVAGDVLDPAAVASVVTGSDAVVSALGIGMSRAATTVYSVGTGHVAKAMEYAGVRRLLVVSTTGLTPQPPTAPLSWAVSRLLLHPMLRRPYADMVRMEEAVRSTALDWTVVRAARLTDGPQTGRYRTASDRRLPRAWSVSRADLAHLLLTGVADPALHRCTVEVAY